MSNEQKAKTAEEIISEISVHDYVDHEDDRMITAFHKSAVEIVESFQSRITELEAEGGQLQRKVDFYRGEVGKIRDFVFDDKNETGLPCQSIFEAIDDRINSLKSENKELREALGQIKANCNPEESSHVVFFYLAELALKPKP